MDCFDFYDFSSLAKLFPSGGVSVFFDENAVGRSRFSFRGEQSSGQENRRRLQYAAAFPSEGRWRFCSCRVGGGKRKLPTSQETKRRPAQHASPTKPLVRGRNRIASKPAPIVSAQSARTGKPDQYQVFRRFAFQPEKYLPDIL